MLDPFERKLLEVLFDGKPEADAKLDAAAKSMRARIAAERARVISPAPREDVDKLASRYRNAALGDIDVAKPLGDSGDAKSVTVFDFGELKSPVASRHNQDGTTSFVTIGPGLIGLEFVVGAANSKRTLTVRDAQHEYVFTER